MRVKSEERRKAIMDAAAQIFREQGFGGTSMAAIAAQVGGSKATLYSYFQSKEALFIAVTLDAVEETAQAMMNLLDRDGADIREVLTEFGIAYLDLLLSPEVVTVTKVAVSLGNPVGLGVDLYEKGPGRGWRDVTVAIARFHDQGLLKTESPKTAALQLKGLLEAGMFEPALFGVAPLFSREEAVAGAIDVFLLKYGI